MTKHKEQNILRDLVDELVNAAYAVTTGANRPLVLAHTEARLGRKLTDSEYSNAFNRSALLLRRA